MRRPVTLALGVLELAAAGILLAAGLLLPSAGEVRQGFDRLERVTAATSQQVASVREQVRTVRDPRLQQFLTQLEPHLPRIKKRLQGDVNLETVRQANRSLGSMATALEEWAGALDPALVGQLSDGAVRLADFLDKSVAAAAGDAAARLEKTTEALRKDADALTLLLRDAPPDLKAAREIHDSLGRFSEGLDRVSVIMDPERLKAMREGFKGMEGSLETGAGQVAKLASYTYPVVKLNGFRPPTVDEKSFWPEGDKIADGMRMGAKALKAAGKELDVQVANLPQLQKSLDESRKAVARTRDMLGKAVKDQDKLEVVLRTVPANTARLAKELPLLSADLARVLRDAEKLKDVAANLRQTQQQMASAVERLPRARKGLLDSAARLRDLQKKLDGALDDPDGYKETLERTIELTDSAANVIPLLSARLERLETQQQGLAELGAGVEEVHASVPQLADTTVSLLTLMRWLLWVAAALAAVHGLSQLAARRGVTPAAGAVPGMEKPAG